MNKHLYPIALLLLVAGTASCGSPHSRSPQITLPDPPYSALPSTEFGRMDWTDTAAFSSASPGRDFYIGAWTHTVEPMGDRSNTTGNDYPFVITGSETVGGSAQLLLTISGNIGYDAVLLSYVYNQNITTNTGDYSVAYINPGEFGVEGQPDEAAMRGWVYVAWHYRAAAEGTVVSQYAKFGPSGPVNLTAGETINGMGGWPPAEVPAPEFVTPVSISVGGGDRANGRMYMQYAKVYVMTDAPSVEEVDAIAMRTAPDPAAWADWPLIGGNMDDVSGNGRALTVKGSPCPGITGPDLQEK